MQVIEYYLFRGLSQLLHKDPGRFPLRVAKALDASGRLVEEVLLLDGFGFIRFLSALWVCWTRPSGHVGILFHLNLRTLLFLILAKCFAPWVRIIIKTDLTPSLSAGPSLKLRLTWRAVGALARVVCVETPEGLEQLKAAGIQNAVFLPNHIDVPEVNSATCSLSPVVSQILLVTRGNDDRKRPQHTLKVAKILATRGWKVLLVGMTKDEVAIAGEPCACLTILPHLEKRSLMEALANATVFVGLSESESYWFLVAEAVALGTPVLCTPTGIAPFLAGKTRLVELVEDVWNVDDLLERVERLLHSGDRQGRFNINSFADQQMADVIEGLFSGENALDPR